MLLDLKQALRALVRRKGFSLLVIASVGIGIGATVGTFGYLSYWLRPTIEAPRPSEVHWIWNQTERDAYGRFSAPDFEQYEELEDGGAFTGLVGFRLFGAGLRTEAKTIYVFGNVTTGDFFDFFGARPALGRLYDARDGRSDAEPVVVLSHLTWRRHFGSDPDVVGKTVDLEGQSHTIIGVAEEGFQGSGVWVHLYVPIETVAPRILDRSDRDQRSLAMLARLPKEAARDSVQDQLSALGQRLDRTYPHDQEARAPTLVPFHEDTQPVDTYQRAAFLLMAATGLLLALAALNVANLMLARTLNRRRELGVLAALGAGRLRVARRLVFECLALAACGGVLGVLLSGGVTLVIESYLRDSVTLGLGEFSLGSHLVQNNALVIPFAIGTTILTAVIFGVGPAVLAARTDVVGALKASGSEPPQGRRLPSVRSMLVVAQVAMSVAVLLGSVMLSRNLTALSSSDLGYDPLNLTLATLYVPRDQPGEATDRDENIERWDAVQEAVSALPGVTAASITWRVPLGFMDRAELRSGSQGSADGRGPEVRYGVVGRNWFKTLGTPILYGRGFDGSDRRETRSVAVVNETAARLLAGTEAEAVSRTLRLDTQFDVPEGDIEIVGVVRDSTYQFAHETIAPMIFLPFEQAYRGRMTLLARSQANTDEAIRSLFHAQFPDVAVVGVHPFSEQVRRSFTDHRMNAQISGFLALSALLLATFGIFSLLSYSVSQKGREIGVRMAIGASPRDVVHSILRSAGRLVAGGVVLGFVLAFALARLLEGLVFGVNLKDPLTFLVVGLVLATSAAGASLVPALRASRTDPAQALRSDN